MASAVIININKWFYFYFRIKAEHRGKAHKQRRDLELLELSFTKKKLNIATLMAALVYICFIISFWIYGCSHNFQ